VIAYDDVGDPDGTPVLYLHGTPDGRGSRGAGVPPGVRLIAPDRPGIGGSPPDPAATPWTVADDHVALLDALGVARAGVLAWSAGSIFALTLAARHPDRVSRLVVAAGLVPADAYADPDALEGANPSRRSFAEWCADGAAPDELAAELTPFVVPHPLDVETALALAEEGADAARAAEVSAAEERHLAEALVAAVEPGLGGIERDIAAQATSLALDWPAITTPVELVYGDQDGTAPPAMGRWLAARLPNATLVVHPGAGHALAIARWAELVSRAAAGPTGPASR
jgi:pimeloyl-ACP methyl ester carboxylesterase